MSSDKYTIKFENFDPDVSWVRWFVYKGSKLMRKDYAFSLRAAQKASSKAVRQLREIDKLNILYAPTTKEQEAHHE